MTPRAALSEYTNVVFTDGFESGGLTNWNGAQGTGTTSVVAAAAHAGGFGARIATLETQYEYLVKGLSVRQPTASPRFWLRLGSGTKVVQVAQARDGSSSVHMWQLAYDGSATASTSTRSAARGARRSSPARTRPPGNVDQGRPCSTRRLDAAALSCT